MLIIGKLVLPMALFSKIYNLAIFVVNEYVGIIVDCSHIGRYQEYFNHIHISIGSTTLQFLYFA